MKKWKRIVIHCSDSYWGSAVEVRQWHLDRGWSDIGYQYVIDNGKIKSNYYLDCMNGSVEVGRPIDGDMIVEQGEQGAHAYGYNSDSIGVCLIGKERFTPAQMAALFDLVSDLMVKFEIEPENVVGHYELDPKKTCPNIDMGAFRKLLKKVTAWLNSQRHG